MNSVWIILGAPLAAALAILFTGRWRRVSAALSMGAILLGFALSLQLFAAFGRMPGYPLSPAPLRWLSAGPTVTIELGALVDRLSLLMLLVVTGVASAIQIYSLGYMRDDPGRSRYFACMSLFAFAMLGIVLASNFIQMFFFWELVGLSSYLLIGYWFERPSAAEAGKKALLVNRVGDFGFLLGILVLWYHAGTFDFAQLRVRVPALGLSGETLTLIGLLIFCGAVGKSAQFPLHVWLPDAMEGPTPVSALIHAATMVAAGVYMLCRVAWLLVPGGVATETIALIGGVTALMAALIAVTQSDIKRILAYSTLSQLGYMVMAVGLGGSLQAMFHLTTHAFFKALLFLGAGSVILALHHEQDIWRMGGLRRHLPITYWTFAVGTLALAGVWPLSGFYSKDEILLLALARSPGLFALGALTAGLTAFYMGRVFCVVFLGRPRDEAAHARVHESPLVMTLPMVFLATLSVAGGWFSAVPRFLRPEENPSHPGLAMVVALLAIPAAGFLLSAWIYGRGTPAGDPLARPLGRAYRFVQNKFCLDELYGWLVRYVQGGLALACEACDRYVVQGLGIGGAAFLTGLAGQAVRLAQDGRVRTYAFFLGAGMELVVYFALVR